MRRRQLLVGGLAVATLAACNRGEQAGGDGKPYIAIVSKGFQHQFWQAVKKGAEQEAATAGATISFEGPATEKEVEAQITMLTNVIAKKPAAIGFAALDSKAAEACYNRRRRRTSR